MEHRRAARRRTLSTASSFRLRAPGEPPNTSSTGPSCGQPEERAAPRLATTGRERAGIGRPVTRYFAPSRPAIGNARNTRRANGAASRFASPRCASASISAAGIRCRRRGEHHRPGDVPAAAEHDVGPPPREDARARDGAPGRRAAARAQEPSDGPPRQPGDPERVELVARLRDELRFDAIRRPGERHLCAAPLQRLRDRQRRRDVSGRPPGRDQARAAFARDAIAAADVKEDADRGERDHEARAAVGDERQRDSGQRREPEHGGEVDRRLAADEHRHARGEPLAERVAARERDPEPGPGEGRVGGDHAVVADRPSSSPIDREDHVRVRLGEVEDLLDALAEARRRERRRSRGRSAPAPSGSRRPAASLHGSRKLKMRARRYGSNQIAASPSATAMPFRDASSRAGVPGDDEHAGEHHDDERDRPCRGRARARMRTQKRPSRMPIGLARARRRVRGAGGACRDTRRPRRERELRELGRLEGDGPERDPAARAVDRDADDEHGAGSSRARSRTSVGASMPQPAVVEARRGQQQRRRRCAA